jgi:cold-inducible RNA-binding protein
MKNVYVGNLPHSTSESELRNLFQPHGDIDRVSMVTDRDTGRSRGFAFVEMTNSEEAEKAIAALNGSDLGGRTLIVNEAKPKTDRPRGGGGQRFGGGGRDGSRGQSRQRREPSWYFCSGTQYNMVIFLFLDIVFFKFYLYFFSL